MKGAKVRVGSDQACNLVPLYPDVPSMLSDLYCLQATTGAWAGYTVAI